MVGECTQDLRLAAMKVQVLCVMLWWFGGWYMVTFVWAELWFLYHSEVRHSELLSNISDYCPLLWHHVLLFHVQSVTCLTRADDTDHRLVIYGRKV